MRFQIEHATRFTYDRPVFIEPMTIRLRPRPGRTQTHSGFVLAVEPEPSGRTEAEDAEGNLVTNVWFEGTTGTLTLTSSFEAETSQQNPFDFVVPDPALTTVPMRYPQGERDALARFLDGTGEVDALAREVLDDAGPDVVGFLDALTRRLHAIIEHEVRDEGDPLPAAETLRAGRGSCRDTTVVFLHACRAVGLAARFVSGYAADPEPGSDPTLHAWAEVYLSGAGWRGFDPSHGLAVADRHIALAAAPDARGAAPTTGTFRGTGARSTLEARLSITPR